MQFVKPQLFTEAVAKIGRQSPIGSKLNSEQWSRVPLALRESAMFSASVENVRFLQASQDFISDFLKGTRDESGALKAGGRAQFVKEMSAFAIAHGMGPLEKSESGKQKAEIQDITSQARLSLIFNTKVAQAQSFGYWQQGMDPDVLDAFPAQHLVREQDVAEPRNQHTRYEGEVRLKSDLGFWIAINQDFGVPWGPWGWGCGHGVEDDDRARAEELGLLAPGQRVTPATKDFNDRLQASVKNIAPELRAKLKEQFGEQIDISGDEVKWRGSEDRGQRTEDSPTNPPAPAPQSVAPPEAAPQRGPTAATAPVSAALAVDPFLAQVKKKAVANALRIVDSVHDDGTLPRITVETATRKGYVAAYAYTTSGRAVKIAVGNLRKMGEHVITHELGHFLDHQALDVPGEHASTNSPALAGWREAVMNSAAVKSLQAALRNQEDYFVRERLKYLLLPQEIFARSYAQWITERSQHPKLLQQLPLIEAHFTAGAQWSTEDFAPIASAFDALFRAKGWMK